MTSRIRLHRPRSGSTRRRAAAGSADTWSSYWYNGKIYANDIVRGLDVFNLIIPGTPYGETWTHLNAQTQEQFYPPPLSTLTPLGRLASGL